MSKAKPVYTPIDKPLSLRKEVLEASLDSITLIKHYEHIKGIKNEKIKIMNELRDHLKETHLSLGHLRRQLPVHHVKENKPKKVIKKQKIEIKKKPVKIAHVSHLDQELDEIRDKLNQINI